MDDIDRRVALSIALAVFAGSASAETYEPDRGSEIAPGVRQIVIGSRPSTLPHYQRVTMRDVVFQPGTNTYDPAAPNDMLCHVTDGILRVTEAGFDWFAKNGTGPWTSAKGTKLAYKNLHQDVAVLRIVDLIAA